MGRNGDRARLLGSVGAAAVCTCGMAPPRRQRITRGLQDMKIVPTRIEEQINRVDPTRSRVIGIAAAITAAWCAYRVLWLVYLAASISSVGWSPVSLVFPFVLWGVIGVVAAIAAVGFLTNAKRPASEPVPGSDQTT
jgi:hypothetical protein